MKSTQESSIVTRQVVNENCAHSLWTRVMKIILIVLVACSVGYGQVTTTLIQDTVYHADGTSAQGSLVITWPAFATAAGAAVPAGSTTVLIGNNGAVSFSLAPNIGATPAGTFYTASYHLDNGMISNEYWVVPATSTTTITAMRSKVVPASVAVQMVSPTYIQSQLGQYLPLKGGSLQGSLVLNSDPQAPLQAATKGYVDSNLQGVNALLVNRVETAPTGSQIVQQPVASTLGVNSLNNVLYASQYGSTTGIANAVSAGCTGSGCHVVVDPGYGNTEYPQGFATANYGFTWPKQTFVQQERNGVLNLAFHSPASSNPEQVQAVKIVSDFDRSQYDLNNCCGGYVGNEEALFLQSNYYTGLDNTQNTFNGVPKYNYGGFHVGLRNELNTWDSGQKLGQWSIINCYGVGDCIGNFNQMVVDGGVNRADDEGAHWADTGVTEDPNVYTGTIYSAVTTGATVVPTSCTYGCNTQGQDRLLIDTNATKDITGTFQAGGINSTNQVPASVIDPTANYPVSTIVSLCYAGSDNGASGVAGCVNGSAPSGYIPPQQNSPSQEQPLASVTTNVLASYSGQPSYICTNATLQSSNSAASCYMPASGVGYLTDANEYESVNYTYNSTTQQITLLNLRFPHSNGMVFATGGLAGYAVEVKGDIYGSVPGGGGTESQVFPVEASASATDLIYISQRTNLGYGLPVLGVNQADNGGQFAVNDTLGSSTLLADGHTVQGYAFGNGGCIQSYNQLPMVITTQNSSYNGTYTINVIGCNSFTYYIPTAPTGTTPSSGTITYTNLGYTLYPSARTNSVYDTAGNANAVDGTFILMPNTVAWANGDTVRQPHYQKIVTTGVGGAAQVTQFSPRYYNGGDMNGQSFFGSFSGSIGSGYDLVNGVASSYYLGYGGTHRVPSVAYQVTGLWSTDLTITAPASDGQIVDISGCPPVYGCLTSFSNFDMFRLPVITDSLNGQNSQDHMNYDPDYNDVQHGTGISSGRIYFENAASPLLFPGGFIEGYGAYSTVQEGYEVADQQISAPTAQIGNITTSKQYFVNYDLSGGLGAFQVGATGSTSYTYYEVAHTYGGGTTVPIQPATVTNGSATLSTTNYIQIYSTALTSTRVVSYDIVKYVGGSYYLVGNIGDGRVGITDHGQTLSLYTAPTVDTTATTKITGLLNVTGTTTSSTVNATSGYQVNGTALAASNLSNGTTGSGAVVLASSPTLSGTATVPIVSITTKVANSAAVQHFTATMCSVAGGLGSSCNLSGIVLPVAEPDTNYVVTCTLDVTSGGSSAILNSFSHSTTAISLQFYNTASVAASGGVANCILMHN